MTFDGNLGRSILKSVRLPLVDAFQMRAIDALATSANPDEGYRLMGLAGKALFRKVMAVVAHPGEASVAIFVGGGNNGGDGLVLARLLQQVKMRHQVYGLIAPDFFKGEAARALADYTAAGGYYHYLESLEALFHKEMAFNLVVDAMLGLGQEGSPRGKYADVVQCLNQWKVPVLAVDCPTGFDCQAGVPGDPCLDVRWTLMLGFPRIEAFCIPGGDFFGEPDVAALEYREEVVSRCHAHNFWVPSAAFAKMLPKRNDWGDKRVQGYAAIVAGSQGMAGAAALCTQAALRSGVGMVHVAVPASVLPVIAPGNLEAVFHPLHDKEQGCLEMSHLAVLETLCDRSDALCIGPGLSSQPTARETVRHLLPRIRKPLVLDADGLNALSGNPALLRQIKAPVVITPHSGEWGRLFGPVPLTPAGTLEAVRAKAMEYGVTIVLKGPPTYIGTPAGETYVVANANSGMAKGGSGDVLAGILVALLAQSLEPVEAALLAVHLHARAGHFAREKHGVWSMQPSDMIAALPAAYSEMDVCT